MARESRKETSSKKPSLGYPRVEKLIESEDFKEGNRVFEATYKELDRQGKAKKGLKTGREAAKAQKAIERVTQLFRELLEVKYRLQDYLKQQASQKKG